MKMKHSLIGALVFLTAVLCGRGAGADRLTIQPTTNGIVLSVQGQPAATYALQWARNLGFSNWLTRDIRVSETNGTCVFFDTVASNTSARFYRVARFTPPATLTSNIFGPEDGLFTFSLEGADPEYKDDLLAAFITSLPTSGQLFQHDGTPVVSAPAVVTDGTRRLQFRGATDEYGNPYTTFHYAISNIQSGVVSQPGRIEVVLTPVPDAPIVTSHEPVTQEESPIIFQLTAHDPDGDDETLVFYTKPPGSGALYQVEADGVSPGARISSISSFTQVTNPQGLLYYVPLADDFGFTSIFYYVEDTKGLRSSPSPEDGGAQLPIHIEPVNDPPIVRSSVYAIDGEQFESIPLYPDVSDIDIYPHDMSAVSLRFTSFSDDGEVFLGMIGDVAVPVVLGQEYSLRSPFNYRLPLPADCRQRRPTGTNTLAYTVTDPQGGTASGTITIIVTQSGNLPPHTTGPFALQKWQTNGIQFRMGAVDPEGDDVIMDIVGYPDGGIRVWFGQWLHFQDIPNLFVRSTDQVAYHPGSNLSEEPTVTYLRYRARERRIEGSLTQWYPSLCGTQTMVIFAQAFRRPPYAPFPINLGATNPVDNLPLAAFYISDPPTNGFLTGTAPNFVYHPAGTKSGDHFTYYAVTASGETNAIGSVEIRDSPCLSDAELAGAVSMWRGEANASDSLGANHGTISSSGLRFRLGKVGRAFNFELGRDSVELNAALLRAPFSIACWVNWQPDHREEFGILGDLYVDRAGRISEYDGYRLPPNTWTHIGFVVRSNALNRHSHDLYINGSIVRSNVAGYFVSPLKGIGIRDDNFGTAFRGMIDELVLFDRAMGPAIFDRLYEGDYTGLCRDGSNWPPLAFSSIEHGTNNSRVLPITLQYLDRDPDQWPFGLVVTSLPQRGRLLLPPPRNWPIELDTSYPNINRLIYELPPDPACTIPFGSNFASFTWTVTDPFGATASAETVINISPSAMASSWRGETNALDSIGTNHGTIQGELQFVPGKVGAAFDFDGSDDQITIGAPAVSNAWTVAMWIKRRPGPDVSSALLMDSVSALKLEQFGSASQSVGITLFGVADYSFNYTASPGEWVHLTFVGTCLDTTLYVNGNYQDFLPVAVPLPLQRIGGGPGNRLSAVVDELGLFSRALGPSEIASIYEATK